MLKASKTIPLTTVCFVGVEVAWSFQMTFTVPLLMHLGIAVPLTSYFLALGPLAGIMVQPTVGAWSDSFVSKHGRRKPFMLLGLVQSIVALMMIMYGDSLGRALGDRPRHQGISICVATVGLVLLNIGINTIQAPARALAADMSEPRGMQQAMASVSAMAGTGQLVGYFFSSLSNFKIQPFITSYQQSACAVAMLLIVVSVSSTLACVSEPALLSSVAIVGNAPRPTSILFSLRENIKATDRRIRGVLLLQLISWPSMYLFLVYNSAWASREVLRAIDDETAVREDARGMVLFSTLSVVGSIALPRLLQSLDAVWVVVGSNMIFGCCLVLTPHVESAVTMVLMIGVCGLHLGVLLTVPHALVLSSAGSFSKGTATGLVNLFSSFPQLVVTLLSGPLLSVTGSSITSLFVFGGILSMLAAAFSFCILVGWEERVQQLVPMDPAGTAMIDMEAQATAPSCNDWINRERRRSSFEDDGETWEEYHEREASIGLPRG